MITEDYVSLEVAKLLKEKGFKEWCSYFYGTAVRHNGEDIDEDEEYELKAEGRGDEIEYVEGGHLYHFNCNNSKEDINIWACPTQSLAMKWLREAHNIDIDIDAAVGMLGVKVYVPLISTYKPLKDAPSKLRQIKRGIYYKDDKGVIPALQHFDSYEEAAEAALKYSLENLI